jgi:hypothetical protein
MREPLTPKQTFLTVATAALLNSPLLTWLFYSVAHSDEASLKQNGPALGALNLVLGVPLLAFITEKWIRKLK